MTTFGDLTMQVKSLLHSFTGVHEPVTWLTAGCTDAATTLTVEDSDAISIGVSEVGEELIYVSASESATNTLTLAPFGRGYRGTTAAAHAINDMVMFNPIFPTVEIKRAINQTLAAVYPQLYQVKETSFTFAGSQSTYELPADCDGVVSVRWEAVGASGYWPLLSGWEFHPHSEEATGKAITVHDVPAQGQTVKVMYRANFTQFAADADTFAGIGFPESAIDVLLYGAAAKLIRFLDVARLQTHSVENISRSQLVGSGDPAKIANQFYAMHAQRLIEERKKLLELEPPQMHFTRG